MKQRRAISDVLINYTLEFYNQFLFYRFSQTFPTGSDFSGKAFPLVRAEYAPLSYDEFRVVGIAFYYFIKGYLQDFSRRYRFTSVDFHWRNDLCNKFSNSYVSKNIKDLEERMLAMEPVAKVA